jgi:flagellar hook protein FlgE
MSLYGALFSAVSGLRAQSTKIAVISDNISNVNTIGYKAGLALFQTLVTNSGGSTSYSPGGVLGGNRQLISQQGLVQSTNSPTDIAISGNGFFVVNQTSDSSGQVLYTRAGSFSQDATGNFRNSAGLFLQAWPLDRDGRLPGEPGNVNTISSANLSSLRTVNVQNLTGVAAATTLVSLSANLKASETIFPGAGLTASMDTSDSVNNNNAAKDIIIPQNAPGSPGTLDSLAIGDVFNIATGTNSTGTDFTYGGFSYSRNINTGAVGDLNQAVLGGAGAGTTTLPLTPFGAANNSNVVTVRHTGHGLQSGDVVTLSGNTSPAGDVGNIPGTDLNGTFVVTVIDANNYSVEVASTNTSGVVAANSAGASGAIVEDVRPYATTGQILDASTVTQTFLGSTGTSAFVPAALSFTISTLATGTATFTYKASSPNAQSGEFNNLNNLAEAINAVDGLTARVDAASGRLYVGAIDAQQAITFANGSRIGADGADPGEALYGIDWVRELGLENVAIGSNRYSTLQGLSDLVNAVDGLDATITSPLSETSIFINVEDPLDTIIFSDDDYGSSPNTGSPLAALGFEGIDPLTAAPVGSGTSTGPIGPAYDPADNDKNMAGGNITPQFSRSIRVFDSLGTGHDINISFIKIAANRWATEVYALNASEIQGGNSLLASGNLIFNGDGSLQSVSSSLGSADIPWATTLTAPESSTIAFNWGTAGVTGTGLTDGVQQFDSKYKINFANQNGAQVGELTSVAIDEEGFITVAYSNGETQRVAKIPLADFASPDSLQSLTGNAFAQTSASGEVNLSQAGGSGVGKIAASSLEASNVELADQLTDMIVAQRAYQANTKVISTADNLLSNLNDVLR